MSIPFSTELLHQLQGCELESTINLRTLLVDDLKYLCKPLVSLMACPDSRDQGPTYLNFRYSKKKKNSLPTSPLIRITNLNYYPKAVPLVQDQELKTLFFSSKFQNHTQFKHSPKTLRIPTEFLKPLTTTPSHNSLHLESV